MNCKFSFPSPVAAESLALLSYGIHNGPPRLCLNLTLPARTILRNRGKLSFSLT